LSTAKKYKIENVVYIGVKLASELTGVEIPDGILGKIESRKVKKLANNRLAYMGKSPGEWDSASFKLNDWLFRIRSRTGIDLKLTLFLYISFLLIARLLLPDKLRKKLVP
jgi:hypothetical protein